MGIIRWFIQALFWLQAFLAPVIFFGLLAFWMYSKGERYEVAAILILAAGGITGIVVAEYIRRKYGLDTFFARIYGPNDMDKKKEDVRE